MNCCSLFSWKNKKNIIKLSSAEFARRLESGNGLTNEEISLLPTTVLPNYRQMLHYRNNVTAYPSTLENLKASMSSILT